MAVKNQKLTERYALYNGDCVEVMHALPDESIDMSLYSPPFAGLYQYSSDATDMSNCVNYDEFLTQYEFCVKEVARLTKSGRISAVHAMDVPMSNSGCDAKIDFSGDIIRLHQKHGFDYQDRIHIWKEPLTVRNRTMLKSLHHKTLCQDSTRVSFAGSDFLLVFRKKGQNEVPVTHETGLLKYAGETQVPSEILKYRDMEGDQKLNRYSQWIWRNYASCDWWDIRIDRTLPHRDGKDPEDEKHVHPLQLDVIERACVMWSNPGEVVLTPFMGVGSEVYGAVINQRRGLGIELKPSYYNQACRNLDEAAIEAGNVEQPDLF